MCATLYICGYNLLPTNNPADLPSVLFLSYMVLYLHDLNNELFEPDEHLLIFPIYILIMYVITQIAMYLMWNPIWHMERVVITWLMETEYALKLHSIAPNLYYFLRNHVAYIIELVSVLSITFEPLKEYFMPNELSFEQLDELTQLFSYEESKRVKAKQTKKNARKASRRKKKTQ